jgi:hypothetical protein
LVDVCILCHDAWLRRFPKEQVQIELSNSLSS